MNNNCRVWKSYEQLSNYHCVSRACWNRFQYTWVYVGFLAHILSFMKFGSSFHCYFLSCSLVLLPVFLAPHLDIFLQSFEHSWTDLLAGYWKISSDLTVNVVAITFVHVVVLHALLHGAVILDSCIASQMLGISLACAVCQSMCSPTWYGYVCLTEAPHSVLPENSDLFCFNGHC